MATPGRSCCLHCHLPLQEAAESFSCTGVCARACAHVPASVCVCACSCSQVMQTAQGYATPMIRLLRMESNAGPSNSYRTGGSSTDAAFIAAPAPVEVFGLLTLQCLFGREIAGNAFITSALRIMQFSILTVQRNNQLPCSARTLVQLRCSCLRGLLNEEATQAVY